MGKGKKERKDESEKVEAGEEGTIAIPFPHCNFCLRSRGRARYMMVGALANICSDCTTVAFGEISQMIQREAAIKAKADAELAAKAKTPSHIPKIPKK